MTTPTISIVLGSFNRRPFLKRAIQTVRDNGILVPYEIIVIDGGSTDGSLRWLLAQKDIITIVQHNSGFWRGKAIERKSWGYYMNIAFSSAHGTYIVMISDDCLVVRSSIQKAYQLIDREIEAGRNIGGVAFYWRNFPYESVYNVRLAMGVKIMINHGMYLKSALAKVGFCEEEKLPFYEADSDLALKLWHAGYEIIDCDEAFVEHFYFASIRQREKNNVYRNKYREYYANKWKGVFAEDETNAKRINLAHEDKHRTADIFNGIFRYHVGLFLAKFGRFVGYDDKILARGRSSNTVPIVREGQ